MVPVLKQKRFVEEAREHCTRLYLPKIKISKPLRHTQQSVIVEKPAFGSYIFVKVRSGRQRDISLCVGFSRWLCIGEVAVIIKPKVIRDVKMFEKRNFGLSDLLPIAKNTDYHLNDQVRVTEGPMMGVTGKISMITEHKSITIDCVLGIIKIPIDLVELFS